MPHNLQYIPVSSYPTSPVTGNNNQRFSCYVRPSIRFLSLPLITQPRNFGTTPVDLHPISTTHASQRRQRRRGLRRVRCVVAQDRAGVV